MKKLIFLNITYLLFLYFNPYHDLKKKKLQNTYINVLDIYHQNSFKVLYRTAGAVIDKS